MSLASQLLRSARSYAGQLTSLAKSFAPKHLQSGIKTTVREDAPGSIIMTIIAKGADAHAQEYGSGLHSQYGKRAKYLIKGKPWLTFMPTNGYKGNAYGAYNPTTGQGVGEKTFFITDKVMHPGINRYQGRGYIRPAVKEFTKSLKENPKIKEELRQAILSELTKSFKTGAK